MSDIPIRGSDSNTYIVDTDTLETIETQVVKLRTGNAGSDGGLVSSDNPLPISSQDFYTLFERLLSAISYPPWLDRSANAIRNQVQSGTVSTVTTCATLTNVSQIDTYPGKLLMIGVNVGVWSNVVRRTIS